MKTREIIALEGVVADFGISQSELINWVLNREQNVSNLIRTPLPLVYCKENEFTVEYGLDLNRKDELWGIQLLSGIMVSLKKGPGKDVSAVTLNNVKAFVKTKYFNGKQGYLPPKQLFDNWNDNDRETFEATVNVVKYHGIEVDNELGWVLCSEELSDYITSAFVSEWGHINWIDNEADLKKKGRVGLFFS